MTFGRRSYEDKSSTKVLDLWCGEETFGTPLGCVTTTYTFDAGLFEEECLAKFLSIQTDSRETTKLYLIEREEKLSQCFVCVLVDAKNVAPDRSLRWNLLPVRVPTPGVMHAKLTLLAWEHRIRILVGSANLTEYGYRRNQEIAAVLDFGADCETPPELLNGAVEFLKSLQAYTPGFGASDTRGPQPALSKFLNSVSRRIETLPKTTGRLDVECNWIPLLPGGPNVLNQLRSHWRGPAPDEGWVLSPFFDEGDNAIRPIKALADILTSRGPREINVTAPGQLNDGRYEIDVPLSLKLSSHRNLIHNFFFVQQQITVDGKIEHRPLHAKSIWLERDTRVLYMLGSSNFTSAGLGLHPRHNIELNLAYSIGDVRNPFGRLCEQSWPYCESITDPNTAVFLSEGGADSSQEDDVPVLPSMFGAAVYYRDDAGPRLVLEFIGSTITDFTVSSREEQKLLDSLGWLSAGKEKRVSIPWPDRRPPASLQVHWHDSDGEECRAYWIVNAATASALPPPDELNGLSLTELIEILTSARPLHLVMGDILKRRSESKASTLDTEIDPHKKVDTSQFLLQRMRRFARALEGLNSRLELPVGSIEALLWRLHGPIGPLALAKQLLTESDQGTSFMIAEIASTLSNVSWHALGSLKMDDICNEKAPVLKELQGLALQITAPESLGSYVACEFRELLK